LTWAQTAVTGLVFRHQLLGRFGDRNLHQRFRFGFRRQIPCDHPVDVGRPQRPVFHQRQIGQKRVRRDANGAALQAQRQLGSLGRVVPPLRAGIANYPVQIGIGRHDSSTPV
jgi:hypothetical protein